MKSLTSLDLNYQSSQASAIAQGQLDPCTMKGFSEFSSCNGQPKKPIAVNNQFTKQETTTEGCFTIVSSSKIGTKKITVMDRTKPEPSLERLSNLKQLISPSNNDTHVNPAKRSSVVPNNNPFKRKKESMVLNECATEHSEVTEVEDLEMTPNSQKSVESKSVVKPGVKKKVTSGKIAESKSESNKNTILNFFLKGVRCTFCYIVQGLNFINLNLEPNACNFDPNSFCQAYF